MSAQVEFRTPQEELDHFSKEISDIKAVLRDLSLKLTNIERHAKRAFGVSKRNDPARNAGLPPPKGVSEATLSVSEALKLFEDLVALWRQDRSSEVEDKLRSLGVPNLVLMARELGITLRSKPSQKTVMTSIVRRVNEAHMLSNNKNVTSPRSEQS